MVLVQYRIARSGQNLIDAPTGHDVAAQEQADRALPWACIGETFAGRAHAGRPHCSLLYGARASKERHGRVQDGRGNISRPKRKRGVIHSL
ncbi:hypothetical protein SF83666_b61920 (plasmid) [Sinorhizobium fredii CCBAU 83666]|nr:hypothetical protein SF83666_b61920 [Sinorhizobium fredii CCBAU 83666]